MDYIIATMFGKQEQVVPRSKGEHDMIFGNGLLSVAGISALWLGMLIALAIEARVKFNAPSLTRNVGLDVGRHVFGVFGRVEIGVLVVLVVFAVWHPASAMTWIAVGLVAAVVVVQAIWLRPQLNDRAAKIIDGVTLPKTHSHLSYMLVEFIKMTTLLVLTFQSPLTGS